MDCTPYYYVVGGFAPSAGRFGVLPPRGAMTWLGDRQVTPGVANRREVNCPVYLIRRTAGALCGVPSVLVRSSYSESIGVSQPVERAPSPDMARRARPRPELQSNPRFATGQPPPWRSPVRTVIPPLAPAPAYALRTGKF